MIWYPGKYLFGSGLGGYTTPSNGYGFPILTTLTTAISTIIWLVVIIIILIIIIIAYFGLSKLYKYGKKKVKK